MLQTSLLINNFIEYYLEKNVPTEKHKYTNTNQNNGMWKPGNFILSESMYMYKENRTLMTYHIGKYLAMHVNPRTINILEYTTSVSVGFSN